MSCKNIFILSLLWAGLTSGEYVQSIYPSIAWDPWNPLFACNEPKINVRIGDIINFLCPSDELKFFVSSSSIVVPHENLFFLGNDKDRYNACNATGISITKKLLSCDDSQKVYTLSFRDIQTKPDSIAFTRGETYYMIGTGFRVKSNLTSTEGGSCRYTDSRGKYKLRLQIYVCKDDESDCHICKSEGCYYKDCGSSCTPWISDGQVYRNGSKCFKLETRTCSDALIGSNQKENRYAADPCSEYLKVTEDLSSKEGVIAGLSIGVVIAFLVGIMFGFLIIKCYNKNHDKMVVEHKSGPVNTESTHINHGRFNKAFSFESLERFSNLVGVEKLENQKSPKQNEISPAEQQNPKSPKKRKRLKESEDEKNQNVFEKGESILI